jgi:hypothetical protein
LGRAQPLSRTALGRRPAAPPHPHPAVLNRAFPRLYCGHSARPVPLVQGQPLPPHPGQRWAGLAPRGTPNRFLSHVCADGRRSAAPRRPAPFSKRGGHDVRAARTLALTAFPALEAGLSLPAPAPPRCRYGRGCPVGPPVARCFGRSHRRAQHREPDCMRWGGLERAGGRQGEWTTGVAGAGRTDQTVR